MVKLPIPFFHLKFQAEQSQIEWLCLGSMYEMQKPSHFLYVSCPLLYGLILFLASTEGIAG